MSVIRCEMVRTDATWGPKKRPVWRCTRVDADGHQCTMTMPGERVMPPPCPLFAKAAADPLERLDEAARARAAKKTFDAWPCAHRQVDEAGRPVVVGTVPCGKCYDPTTPVDVAPCAVYTLCVAKPIANTPAQQIDGVRPHQCGERCKSRTPPEVANTTEVGGTAGTSSPGPAENGDAHHRKRR